jgi:endonuclease YncB( thermonuclease family)
MKALPLLLFLFLIPNLSRAQDMRTVTQVIYGDTLVLNGGEVVRLIGVWAPKVQEKYKKGKLEKPNSLWEGFQNRAIQFSKGMVEGRQVWLGYDDKVKKNDQGQTLAYVYFKLDTARSLGGGGQKVLMTPGTYMLNRLLVAYGFGKAYSNFSFPYRSEFNQLQNDAQFNRTGLWQNATF